MPNEPDHAAAEAAGAAPDTGAAHATSAAPASAGSAPTPQTPPADSPAPQPGASSAAPKPPRLVKRWSPPPPAQLSTRTMWLFVGAAVLAVGGLLYFIIRVVMPDAEPGPPQVGAEFECRANNFTIHPPLNWIVSDPHDDANIYIKGPREIGFPPLIVVSLHIKPGGIESFLREHKGRITHKDKTVAWMTEESDSIDGCAHTVRLEYECNTEMDDGSAVRVRALQYIMEDRPRFYTVTCFASPEVFERYLPRFEASARSFRRTPIRAPAPQALP